MPFFYFCFWYFVCVTLNMFYSFDFTENVSIQKEYSDSSNERCCNKSKYAAQHLQQHNQHQQQQQRPRSKTEQARQPHEGGMKRSSSCSALPSNIKPLDRHNPRIPPREIQQRIGIELVQRSPAEIEAKENAILKECYRNERASSECLEQHCSYVIDCGIHGIPSKFPLPERLNYPLNKYYKSDTNLNRLNLHPIKKIRSSIRKLKSKTPSSSVLSTPERYEHYTLSSASVNDTLDSMDSSYLNYLTESENSEAIMARLAKSPSSRKAWLKKVFKWKKLGKTYTPKHDAENNNKNSNKNSESIIYSESPSKSMNARSHSTRSIPDAIKQMWTKLHDMPNINQSQAPATPALSRATSMPSILAHRISKQKVGDVIYFNEKGFDQHETKNIFQNFFKPMENIHHQSSKLKGGNDVITRVLGYEDQKPDFKKSLVDAKLSHGQDNLCTRNENNNQIQPKNPIPQYYTSCQDLRFHQSSPVSYPPMGYPPAGHCQCCRNSQPEQYMGRPDMYIPQYQYPNSGHLPYQHGHHESGFIQPVTYYSRCSAAPTVVAPLDVKVSSERKAERRKICEMVFDTFV